MKLKLRVVSLLLLVPVSALIAPKVLEATAPRVVAPYEVTWWTVDGGGAQNLTGGTYTLSGTIGQPDASAMSIGTYSEGGGFWSSVQSLLNAFLPLIRK